MIRLIIADDHAIVREGLRQLFTVSGEIQVIAEATCADDTLAQLTDTTPDLLLLDLSMPGTQGMDLIGRIRAAYPRLPILILTMHDEPQTARRALNAGATGYLTKDNDPENLLDAIRTVAAGRRYIDPRLSRATVFAKEIGGQPPHKHLSEREYHILTKLLDGSSVTTIATELGISPRTVSTHKSRMMEKLGVDDNTELTRYAIEWGLMQ